MTVRIRLEGSAALQAALRDASDDVRAAASIVVQDAAVDLEAYVKLSIQQGAKTGRVYRRGNVFHQASAPGQSPASDTGRLFGSIYHQNMTPLTAIVGAGADYAIHLEYGTRKMAARPFFRPAVERMRGEFLARLEAAIAGEIR